MRGRSDDPSHHERTLLPRSYTNILILAFVRIIVTVIVMNNFVGITVNIIQLGRIQFSDGGGGVQDKKGIITKYIYKKNP